MTKDNNYIWQARFALKNNWIMAVNILENAIKELPEDKSLYFELADIYANRKNYENAIENYEKILKLDSKDDYARFKLGNCYLSLDEAKLALSYYNEITEEMPEAMYNKAIALQRLNKMNESIKILKELIDMNPDSELPYFFLIEELVAMSKSEKALEYIKKAEVKFYDNPTLHFYKGVCFVSLENYLKGYNEYKIAEKLGLNTSNFYQAFGLCSQQIGKSQESIYYLEKALEISPKSTTIYLELIRLMLDLKDFERAKLLINELNKISPNSAAIARNLLKSYKK